jgi:Zn-dependent protease/CBS domain-containing protein
MGAGGSIQLARIFGIRIGVSPSWFVILFVMIYLLEGFFAGASGVSSTTSFVLAVVGAFAYFLSIVLHELGHALAAKRLGIGITGIDLWFFGGLAKMSRDTATPGEELQVSAAGPVVTAIIVGVCFGLASLVSSTTDFVDSATFSAASPQAGLALLGFLASVNVLLLAFNLIPAFPLDGGRIARAAIWKATGDRTKATRASGRLGQGFAFVLAAIGVVIALRGDAFDGLWLVVLSFFLFQGAQAAVVQADVVDRLDGVTAGDLVDPNAMTLDAATPVADARATFDRADWPWFGVVDAEGRFAGVVRRSDVDAEVDAGRPATPVGQALDDRSLEFGVPPQTSLEALLGFEPLSRLGAVMVVGDDGRLQGVVSLERVRRALAAAV